jgi:Mlc titration factor MtfA (ptsG expression regulator)
MLFTWLKNRRRRKILAEPFPEVWLTVLCEQVGHYQVLDEAEQRKLRDAVQIMLAEKEWEGCRGFVLTEAHRVVIAGFAAVLILGFDEFYFDNVSNILVRPNEFVQPRERILAGEATIVEEDDVLGQATRTGAVVLSWQEVVANEFGQNIVFHEFAHQLDMLNGAMDGTPNLPTNELAARWAELMHVEFRRLRRAERKGKGTLLDPYGATDPAEFFAVTTECFFDAPQAMAAEYPQLYALFRDYYRQDPAAWRPFDVRRD